MTLDNNFSDILRKIIKDEKSSDQMFNFLKKLKKKEKLDDLIVIFLIKSILLVISYYPNKIKKLLNFFKIIVENNSESKKDLILNLKKIEPGDFLIHKNETADSNDYFFDRLIFKTFAFIDLVMDLNEKIIITLLNEILLNVLKIKSIDTTLKIRIFIIYLKDATSVIKDNKGSHVYLKVLDICGSTTKIINNFLN